MSFDIEEGDIFYDSASPFEFTDILNSTKQKSHKVFGTLILPEEEKKYYPFLMLFMEELLQQQL